ncbi:quorum-sensing autoinducer CAI-1 synthase [Granulosicoccaceae sp. 1_MG-2023]|nr:quorum-sensing autoinducer CAI-1 synthase [Granulosicoccaceae sp. 1_MG-2023]
MTLKSASFAKDLLNRKLRIRYAHQREQWHGHHLLQGSPIPADGVNLISNDYLSIAGHQRITNAQTHFLNNGDNPNVMSAVFLEEGDFQHQIEAKFARWMDADTTAFCQSGYAANTGLIQSLLDNESFPVYTDMLAHMSLWDGVTMGGGTAVPFRHNDMRHLDRLIRQYGPGLVVVDAIYSTTGTVCPLQEMVNIARHHGCLILVDESHSLGVCGPAGSGLVCELGLTDEVHFRTASLAKAFASRAGIVTCPPGYKDCFNTSSKQFIFSSALLPHEVAGLDATLDLIASADARRTRLQRNSRYMRDAIRALGIDIGESASQIIPLVAGEEWGTITLRKALEKRGLFGSPFCAPATAKKRSLIRLSVNAALEPAQCDKAIDAIAGAAASDYAGDWRCYRQLQKRATAA